MTAAQALRALGGAPESARTLTNAELYAKVDGRLLLSIQNVAERMLAQGLSQAEVLSRLADACFMSVQGLARVLKRGRGEAQPTQEEGEKRPRGRPWSLSEEDYQAAAEAAKGLSSATNEQLLDLYKFYKQATVGDCNTTSLACLTSRGRPSGMHGSA